MAAGGSSEQTLKIYNTKDGTLVRSVESGSGAIYTTYFDAKGKNVVISTANGPLKAVDVATGTVTLVDGAVGYLQNFDFSRDGRFLCGPAKGGVVVWDARTWQEVRKLAGNTGGTSFAAFSPDGRTVATTGSDGKVRLFEVATGNELAALGQGLTMSRLKFTEDGATLVVCGQNGTVHLFGMSKAGRPVPKSADKQEGPSDDPDE